MSLFAQNNFSHSRESDIFAVLNDPKTGSGTVKVTRDDNIDILFYKHLEYNQKQNSIMGYRIRIFSDSGQPAKQKALNERAHFVKDHSDVSAYLVYDTPNFKIYVGDFRTKSEALKLFKQIKKDFPKAFIVSEKINPIK
jgi:hypothetical protein